MFRELLFAASFAAILSAPAMGQVTWDTAGSGSWADPANWSSAGLPGLLDDVVINQGGGFTITVDDSVPAVNTLMSVENIAFADERDLTLQNGGSITGDLTLGVNSELTINGGAFAATGNVTLDGGNVFANGGSNIDLSAVTSYLTDTGTNASRNFTANDASTIDLSGLTDMTGGGFIRTLRFNANNGSSIDLSGLTNYLGLATQFTADGSGSSIDVSSMADFTNTSSNSFAFLKAADGGVINANSLAVMGSVQGNQNLVVIDGVGSTLNAAALTTLNNVRVELINGGTHDFSGITSFNGSSALADSGVTLDLTGITSYDANGGGNQTRFVTAEGAGTMADLSNLSTVNGGTFIRRWDVTANDGGSVDLSGLVNYTGGTSRFIADGSGSTIDISAIANMTNDNTNSFGFIRVANGGTINANSLTTLAATTANRNGVIVDGVGSTLNASLLTNAVNSSLELTNGGTHDFSGITSFNGGSAIADSGVILDLTGVTSYDVNAGGNTDRQFSADGVGTVVDASNVTTIAAGTFIRSLDVTATSAGTVDFSGVTDMTGAANFVSDGVGSVIDFSALQNFNDNSNSRKSVVEASNGGEVQFGANDLVLTNVGLRVEAGGMMVANSIELVHDASTDSGAADDAKLFGDGGTVVADVFNTSGIIAPGNSAGTLTIDGDLTQGFDGTLSLEIFDESTFDKLFVLGNAELDGIMEVAIDDGFDLGEDMEFLVLDVGGTLLGQFAGLAQGDIVASNNGFDLRVDYVGGDGNDVVLTTSFVAVPEPSSLLMISAAMFGLVMRRKRKQ